MTPKPGSRRSPAAPKADPGFLDMPTMVRARADIEALQVPPDWALVVYAGATLGRFFPLPLGEVWVGRTSDSGIALLDGEVSRRHARIQVEGGRVLVEDLSSTNGTRVNGRRIQEAVALRTGDRLEVGSHVLKLVYLDPLERAFHETLLDLSTKDPLTGLANRGNILKEFQHWFNLSQRYERPLSVAVCDLDHFKDVNDSLGHGAGDAVLHAFGERLMASLREPDLAGRIGGEEFLFILPETDLSGALPFSERFRESIGSRPFLLAAGPRQVTCSLGIAERMEADQDAGHLLARADAALYRAKAEGRNRVSVG